jgi:hypothetical protein
MWIGPMQRSVRTFVATRVGNDVVLDALDPEGAALRWSFTDVAPESFTWTNATLADDGAWIVTQRFAATRAPRR